MATLLEMFCLLTKKPSLHLQIQKKSIFLAIPIKEAEDNDNIAILVTSHGGHIGFLEGMFPRKGGYMYRMFSRYIDAVFKHGPKSVKTD